MGAAIAAFDVVASRCFSNTGWERSLSQAGQSLANPLPLTHTLQINGWGGESCLLSGPGISGSP